ncbi:MAG: pyruvate dehydrogenase complex E1 component subunit beta [Proteobacteria bacterium]|nr:pyruvate dehydrogenase complex E1 component subunit beta [Pseudomonadota bacterium]MDA1058646.1 pyruvate dehydrogenase complex E1 component subunit beta [Pseudomonadota bacterium]
MPIPITMPALSPTMEEGTLAKWLKAEGDAVAPGDVLAEIETDKATMEIEAIDEGILGKILVAEGTEGVKVNAVIAHLLEDGEDAASNASVAPAGGNGAAAPVAPAAPAAAVTATASQAPARPAAATIADPDLPAGTAMVELTVREALRDAMAEEMRRDDRVFLMGEEVAQYQGAYKVSQGLLEEFGAKRVVDTPITEHGFAGVGVGAAYRGLRPIVEFMTFNFALQAMDHLINSAAKTLYMTGGAMPVPIVFRGPNGAAARVAAQHSQNFAAWYASVPGLKVVAPYSAADAKGLLKAAIRDPNPVIFLENEILYGVTQEVPQLDDYVVPIGKARVARPGRDVTIVAYSISVRDALNAAELLAADGIDAEVIDLRTLRPMDTATIVESVRKTNRIVAVEEGWPVCGICSEIAAVLMEQAFDDLDAPMLRVTGEDVPMPYAANLEALALPNPDKIVQAVKAVCYRD